MYFFQRTVTKYVGEISDFKIQLRRQMQMDNLIDGDPNASASHKEISLVPLAPKKAYSSGSVGTGAAQIVNNIVMVTPPQPPKQLTEEEKILQARLELSELAIAKQRARQVIFIFYCFFFVSDALCGGICYVFFTVFCICISSLFRLF